MYADNIEYDLNTDRRNVTVTDRYVNFNTPNNKFASVFGYQAHTNSVGFVTASTELSGGHSFTLETELLLPLKPLDSKATYIDTNVISSSLFGVHGVIQDAGLNNTGWPTGKMSDAVNFQVYAVRDEVESTSARFVLTGSSGGYVPSLKSTLYENVYDNTRWNISVRVRPEQYPLAGFVTESNNGNFIVELHGVQAEAGEILQEFTVSGTVTNPTGSFITGSRRVYVGAHRTDFTSSVLATSDVKVNACRYWLDYLEDEVLTGHILDTENHGALLTDQYAYTFNPSASNGDITKMDTLVFNWEFLNNTGSDSSGQFTVDDVSSGSADLTRFGALGPILNRQYTGLGYDFTTSSVSAIDKDFVVSSKLNLPENVQSADMVKVLTSQEQDVFTRDTRPINYYFAFEKSMYQVISEEIINYFANLKDFHNLIGEPVNLYRPEYKSLKFLRQKFFEKVSNPRMDFDKFYEYYKWFDSSLSAMLNQLVPASSDFSNNVRTMIEDHALERSKHRRIFPFLERKGATDITGAVDGGGDGNAMIAPESPPGSGFFTNTAFTKRQIGSSNTIQIDPWKHLHSPVPESENNNIYWQRYRRERYGTGLATTSSTDSVRQDLLTAIKQTYNRRIGSPAKFSVEGAVTFGGVARHQNNRPNYVFREVAPLPGASGSLKNILVTQKADVEELLSSSSDVYYPSLKQRLGFKMNPDINVVEPNDRTLDGNVYAPFSMYSSSVSGGYASRVSSSFTPGVEITNLHHDFVDSNDIPMQGPFTEKFVGGRFYRHVPLNRTGSSGTHRLLDNEFSRPEASAFQFAGVASNDGGNFSDSLAVIPADSSGSATTRDFPTAVRFRDETAKRPVNIKNILMTTSSLDVSMSGTIAHSNIGNYQKNYQVVQSAGRTTNDPFFKDQSFTFSEFPETLATRGRFPLYEPDPILGKSFLFGNPSTTPGGSAYLQANKTTLTEWNDVMGSSSAGGAKPYSMSWWMYINSFTSNAIIMSVGQTTYGRGREMRLIDDTHMDGFRSFPGWNGYRQNATNMTTGVWYHCVSTYAGMAGGYSGDVVMPDVYLNGANDNGNVTPSSAIYRIGSISQPLRVGWNLIGSNAKFDGHLCDVTIYNKELTAAEVTEIYNGGTRSNPLQSSVASSVIVYYPMGNVPGDTYNGDITDLGADNLGVFSNSANLTGVNVTSSAAISSLSPSNLPVDQFEVFAGPGNRPTANTGGNLNYAIPARTGSDSNETIIVNRYAGSGYEVMSLGYMDPAHEELSVYNASPYHNLSIIDYGLSGSASVDFLAAKTITVVDQIDKNRGLDQRATLHCGPFGSDAAYGTVPSTTYVTTPSWHKTNRNVKAKVEDSYGQGYVTSSNYDNLFVQHAIPQSDMQYSWISSSARGNIQVWGLSPETCTSASVLRTVSGSGRIVGFGQNGLQLNSSSLGPLTSSGGQEYALENGRGTPITFTNSNLIGPASVRPIDIGQHILYRPQGAFNRRAIYMSGTLDANKASWIYAGTADYWNNIIGGSGANAKPFTIAFWMRPEFNFDLSSRVFDFGGGLHCLVTALPPTSSAQFEENFDFSWTRYGSTSNGTMKTAAKMMWGEWYHCIMTFDGGDPDGDVTQTSMRTYINGKKDCYYETYLDNPRVFTHSGRSCYFGNTSGAPDGSSISGRNFFGELDEIMIFTSSVNDVQAEILFNHYTPGDPYVLEIDNPEIKETVQSLTMWWRGDRDIGVYGFVNDAPPGNEISGAIIHDHSGNGRDGVVGLGSTAISSNPETYFRLTASVPANTAGFSFNAMLLNQNGPYGYPSWKQIRAGEHPVARRMRKQNLIGHVLPNPTVTDNDGIGSSLGLSPIGFADYYESPVNLSNNPINFILEDNTDQADSANNMQVTVPFANEYEYFSNNGLNNLCGLTIDTSRRTAYNAVLDYALQSNLSLVANYSQRVYPSEKNVFKSVIRSRPKYNITTMWFNERAERTSEALLSRASSSMGYRRVLSQSVWLLDGHNNFKTTSSLAQPYHNDGAGELLASYTTFTGSTDDPERVSLSSSAMASPEMSAFPNQYAGVTYAERIFGGHTLTDSYPILAGDAEWLVSEQSGKYPYEDYKSYEENIRAVGKDHSIIPEFRISEHMETYVDREEENFLADIDGIFELTGTAYSSSAMSAFYKTYSNGDFLKYFKIIDDDLFAKRSGNLKIVRDKITLSCNGLIKFLPYKGFTPAERVLELGRLFSSSYADSYYQETQDRAAPANSSGVDFRKQLRILMDPLFSPGILCNTIKSGIAVSNFVVTHTASGPSTTQIAMISASMTSQYANNNFREGYGNVGGQMFEEGPLFMDNVMEVCGGRAQSRGYRLQKVPFEALYRPEIFFDGSVIKNMSPNSGSFFEPNEKNHGVASGISGGEYIFDRYPSSSVAYVPSFLTSSAYTGSYGGTAWPNGGAGPFSFVPRGNAYIRMKGMRGSSLYTKAIDNFLCESSNIYLNGYANFESKREEQFNSAMTGTLYSMEVRLYRTGKSGSLNSYPQYSTTLGYTQTNAPLPDRERFTMYSRESSFGPPAAAPSVAGATFAHCSPPYYNKVASALLIYSSSSPGTPSLSDIFSNLEVHYSDGQTDLGYVGSQTSIPYMQLNSCLNLLNRKLSVPEGTQEQKSSWVIQSKFETPVLNFANVSASAPPSGTVAGGLDASRISTKGMWHQYGQLPSASDEGIFLEILDRPVKYDLFGGAVGEAMSDSLAKLVGFTTGVPRRIGRVKDEHTLEEAIVAVPFKTVENQREFFALNVVTEESKTYTDIVSAMQKYVFPPKMDFIRNPGAAIQPILMYVFEFSVKLKQKDLTDMWQNLTPSINDGQFQQKSVTVEDKQLVDIIANNDEDVRWMVFKVKRRARSNFERYRRSLITDDLTGFEQDTVGPYSYNWPYDYFSLVELAKIDEGVQYKSADLINQLDVNEAGGTGATTANSATAAITSGAQGLTPRLAGATFSRIETEQETVSGNNRRLQPSIGQQNPAYASPSTPQRFSSLSSGTPSTVSAVSSTPASTTRASTTRAATTGAGSGAGGPGAGQQPQTVAATTTSTTSTTSRTSRTSTRSTNKRGR